MTPESILEEIKERADKATEGPWSVYGKDKNHVRTEANYSEFRVYKIKHKQDAQFIAHARTDVPRLVEALAFMLSLPLDVDCVQLEKGSEPITAHEAVVKILSGEE